MTIRYVVWVGLFCVIQLSSPCVSWSPAPTPLQTNKDPSISRRDWAGTVAGTTAGAALLSSSPAPAVAVSATGLAVKLASRDPNALGNSVFNVPPAAQVYPEFLRGSWDISCKFGGFLFPSSKITKQRVTQNFLIPGFQKCSIAAFCDVGKDVDYQMRIDEKTGLEDRIDTLTSQVNANLGYAAVNDILYTPKSNPNRLSIEFVEYKTKNAERIELFCNARESELVQETGVFVCSEHIRQVTFGTGSEVGIPRQVVGNYAHFWTWRETSNPEDPSRKTIKGNLLTAAYLDPQDPMFFEEPSKPVAVYSHVLMGVKKPV